MSRLNSQVRFMNGLREEDANIRLDGLRERDARIELEGLRESDANIVLEGLREEDARIRLSGLREEDADIRLDGLRESDANIELKSCYVGEIVSNGLGIRVRRIQNPVLFRKMAMKHRVPNLVDRYGSSRYLHPVKIEGTNRMGDIFDIFRSLPSATEYLGRLKIIIQKWGTVEPRFIKLPIQTKEAIMVNMDAAKASYSQYQWTMPRYLEEGYAKIDSGRVRVLSRLEAYFPTFVDLLAQAETLGPATSPQEEQQRTTETAKTSIDQRIATVGKSDLEKALPYVGAAVGTGVVIAIVVALIK